MTGTPMTLGVVIPCHRQESHLPRTVAALERALAGRVWRGAVVLGGRDDANAPLPRLGPAWQVLAPPPGVAGTPGAARMLGFAAVEGEWTLFVDADTEIEPAWLERALDRAASGAARDAGYGGRLEERVTDGVRDWAGERDLNRVGDTEHEVAMIATPALYRRAALLEVGGYDTRLGAEEDFELGLRLRQADWRLRVLAGPAGRHWNAPRPSLGELARRWRFGLTFGPGEALRLYLGRRGFGELLRRQWLPLLTLLGWCAGLFALFGLVRTRDPRPLVAWLALLLLALVTLALRKRSFRLAAHALLTWTTNGLGVVVGFTRPSRRGVFARGRR